MQRAAGARSGSSVITRAARAAAPQRAENLVFIQPVISIPASGDDGGAVVLLRWASSPLTSPVSASAVEEEVEELAAWLGLGPLVTG